MHDHLEQRPGRRIGGIDEGDSVAVPPSTLLIAQTPERWCWQKKQVSSEAGRADSRVCSADILREKARCDVLLSEAGVAIKIQGRSLARIGHLTTRLRQMSARSPNPVCELLVSPAPTRYSLLDTHRSACKSRSP